MEVNLTERTNHELNVKMLNDRLIRSVSEVIHREVEEYLAERLKDYSLYKDTYEQIMNISSTSNSSPTCEQLKQEIEDLKEQLNEYRRMVDACDSETEGENISLAIQETRINTIYSGGNIEFVEPIMSREQKAFFKSPPPSAPQENPEDSPEDDDIEVEEEEEENGDSPGEEEEEEEEEVYEITIEGKKYYTTDEKKKNGDIFEILPDEDVGPVVGRFKNGKCHFI